MYRILIIFFFYTAAFCLNPQTADSTVFRDQKAFTEKQIPETVAYWETRFTNFKSISDIHSSANRFRSQLASINYTLSDSALKAIIRLQHLFFKNYYSFLDSSLKRRQNEKDRQETQKTYRLLFEDSQKIYLVLGELYTKIDHLNPDNETHRFFLAMKKGKEEHDFHRAMKHEAVKDFSFITTSGVKYRLSAFRGRFVLLHFWSMHSIPCIDELGDIKEVYAKFRNRSLVIISVNTDPLPGKWQKEVYLNFIKQMELDWLHVADGNDKKLSELFYIRNYPTLILINPQGFAVEYEHRLGKALRGDKLQRTLEKYLNR